MAKAIVTTICRTVAIVAVWMSASVFLTFGLPELARLQSRDSGPFSLAAVFMVTVGVVLATAVIWLGGRSKQLRDYKGRAFEVVPPPAR